MFKKTILLFTLLLSVGVLCAQEFPEPMKPARLVNDFVGVMNTEQKAALESKLASFAKSSSTQIAVVTVADLNGLATSDYAAQLFDKWGVGGAENNNGILILVKPKTVDSNGEVFIATGYGVEGAVPDALAGRIVDYDIIPYFKQNQYYAGIDKAATTLIALTSGEYTAKEYLDKKNKGQTAGLIIFLFFIVIFFIMSARAKKRGYTVSKDGDVAATTVFMGGLPFLMGGRRGGGDDFGGFGGFSGGGGFGGFGGGMSGGGGAGGSW